MLPEADGIDEGAIDRAARRLRAAYGGAGVPPLRDCLAPHDLRAAYAVQEANTAFWRAQGREIAGFKIGLTAPATRKSLGVAEPDAGVLFRDAEIADGGAIAPERLLDPRVEGEIALLLGRDLVDPDASPEGVVAAVAAAAAAIEVVDSRIAGWRIQAADTVADNGSAGLFVLGPAIDRAAFPGLDVCTMTLVIDGQLAVRGIGSAAYGHPLAALAWLARHRATSERPLLAGDVVLTGALGPMVPLAPGATASVEIVGLGSATVTRHP